MYPHEHTLTLKYLDRDYFIRPKYILYEYMGP